MGNTVANKYICVNLDKEEYIEVGELPTSSRKDTPEMNTIEYLLASDWGNCRIAFAFEGMQISEEFPTVFETLYDYAVKNYDERTVLSKVPEYRYVLNLSKGQYYDILVLWMVKMWCQIWRYLLIKRILMRGLLNN